MTTLEESAFIRRGVDDVFAFVADQHNAVRWQKGLVEVRRITDGAVGVGTRHAFVRKLLGRNLEAQNEYTVYEPGQRVSFKTITGPLALHASYLTVARDGGTQLTSRIELQRPGGIAGLLFPLMVRSIRGQMHRDFGTLKQLLESGA